MDGLQKRDQEEGIALDGDTEETIRARLRMVEEQIAARGISDPRVLRAMRQVPRHLFVPRRERPWAYSDGPLPLDFGQTISQPFIVALMSQALNLSGSERVLEIGTGSGYQAALLGSLAREVYSVERLPELANRAKRVLATLGILNVTVIVGNGTLGLPEKAPFDAILVTAGAPEVPDSLTAQLRDGGRIVLPVGERREQTLLRITRVSERFEREELGGCAFVPLIGQAGWRAGYEDSRE
jgi:protein-L-isoaspartate(D-aspartate) O-methyltransferase